MSFRAGSPVSPASDASSADASSVGHSLEMNEEASGCLCYSCGDPSAGMDEDFLYLFRPHEGHSITLCERKDGQVIDHRLERIHFGNTRYLRQFLKPALHYRPLKFDVGQLCRDHQRGWCQRGPMCRFIHICRKLPLKAPSPYQQYGAGAADGLAGKTSASGNGRYFPSPSERRVSSSSSINSSASTHQQVATAGRSSPNIASQFGEPTPETTVQGLLAALHASTCANIPQQTYTQPQPLQQGASRYVPPSQRLNPEAEAYQPLGFIPPYMPRSSSAPGYSVPHNLTHASFLPTSSPQVPSFVAPQFLPNNNITLSVAEASALMSHFNNQHASMVDRSSLSPASCPSTSPPPHAATHPSSASPVPASIADLWNTPMSPAISCAAAANSGSGSGVVGSESLFGLNPTMLDSLRSFAMSFAITSQ